MRHHAGIALAILLISLIAASLIWLRRYTPFGSISGQPPPPNFGLRLNDSELTGFSHGRPAWKFKARLVEVSRDRAYTTFTDITSGAVYDKGKPALRLSGRRLVYNTFTHDIEASGGITARAGRKLTVATQKLTWTAYQQKLNCPGRVTITTDAGKGSAESLTADLREGYVDLDHAHLRLPAQEDLLQRSLL